MIRKIVSFSICLFFLSLIFNSSIISQQQIYGAKKITAKASFNLKVIKKNYCCYFQCINWFFYCINFCFHEKCNGIKYPINNEREADCALEKFGFTKEKISKLKEFDERELIDFLFQESFRIKKYSVDSDKITLQNLLGKTLTINIWNF
ncbi:MAG TPA: hypothetical protein VIR55_12520 [Ignavibacteria bacterium]